MSEQTTPSGFAWSPPDANLRERLRQLTGYWWVGLVAGVAWLAIAVVILQFDSASITTVGILVGLMFLFAGLENVVARRVPGSLRWPSIDLRGPVRRLGRPGVRRDRRGPSPAWRTCSASCS